MSCFGKKAIASSGFVFFLVFNEPKRKGKKFTDPIKNSDQSRNSKNISDILRISSRKPRESVPTNEKIRSHESFHVNQFFILRGSLLLHC